MLEPGDDMPNEDELEEALLWAAKGIGRAVQKAIQDSTDATNGDVGAFLRSLREQGYCVQLIDGSPTP